MLESFLGPLAGVGLALIRRLVGKPHFELFPRVQMVAYEDRAGSYLAVVLKVANIGKETAYWDRIECRTSSGTPFLCPIFGIVDQAPIESNKSVTVYIPSGVFLDHDLIEMRVFDAVERTYVIKRRLLARLRAELAKEEARLEALGYEVKFKP